MDRRNLTTISTQPEVLESKLELFAGRADMMDVSLIVPGGLERASYSGTLPACRDSFALVGSQRGLTQLECRHKIRPGNCGMEIGMNLKGIVLAGGTGSRLRPLTKVTNKHLLPVGSKPMIYYPIEKLCSVGIEEILIVTGVEHMGSVVGSLGSGREFGCRFTYKVQDEAGGIAQALGLAENFVHGDPLAVILGDNIFQSNLKPHAERFLAQDGGARLSA